MELWQLRYFVGVAEALNFRKAAGELHVTQPALSRQIRELEDELGVELFVRNHKMVALTEGGRLLLPHARELMRNAARVRDVMSRVSEGGAGSIKVGVATALAQAVRRVIVEYTHRFPKIDVQCEDMFSTLQNKALRTREIDIAFMRPPVDDRHCLSETLFEERFLVILPKDSPLAKRKSVRLGDVAHMKLLLPKRSQSILVYDTTLDMYRAIGKAPQIVHTQTIAEHSGGMLVESGKGIFIVPRHRNVAPNFGRGTVALPLSDPPAGIEVCIAWRKEESSTRVLKFVETARKVFGRPTRGADAPAARPEVARARD
jgi:DNA-binding transcriptional LysR family regulator